jgi:exosortase N
MITRPVSILKAHAAIYFFPVVISCIGYYLLQDYLESMIPVFLCGIGAIAASSYASRKNSSRYAVVMVMMLALSFVIPVKSIFYFTAATGFFFHAESRGRRIGFPGLAALIVSSPVFAYAVNAFSFPIRLQLSNVTGRLFSLWEKGIAVHGNVIVRKGVEFSVDPACMGLHMLSISILSGILFAGLLQRKMERKMSSGQWIIFIALLFLFNIISNLIRIIVLVQFTILPESVWHDLVGVACLVLYVCIPAAFVARSMIIGAAKVERADIIKPGVPYIFQLVLLAGLLLSALHVNRSDTYEKFRSVYATKVDGFHSSLYAPGIMKLQREDALIYVKFIRGFYDTEHNPTMCWTGSGYEFTDIKNEKIDGMEVFTASLKKDGDQLYTAWWFGNDHRNCTDQWSWRKDMLLGARNYAVINVTAADRKVLLSTVMELKNKRTLSPLFQP